MKKLYVIADAREGIPSYVTDPLVLSNDVQACIAYADYQKNLLKNHVIVKDLRLYMIGEFDEDDPREPIHVNPPEEIPVNLTVDDLADTEVSHE